MADQREEDMGARPVDRDAGQDAKDAARYRWLRGNGAIISRAADIPVHKAHFGIGLDAAIDAARAASEQPMKMFPDNIAPGGILDVGYGRKIDVSKARPQWEAAPAASETQSTREAPSQDPLTQTQIAMVKASDPSPLLSGGGGVAGVPSGSIIEWTDPPHDSASDEGLDIELREFASQFNPETDWPLIDKLEKAADALAQQREEIARLESKFGLQDSDGRGAFGGPGQEFQKWKHRKRSTGADK